MKHLYAAFVKHMRLRHKKSRKAKGEKKRYFLFCKKNCTFECIIERTRIYDKIY